MEYTGPSSGKAHLYSPTIEVLYDIDNKEFSKGLTSLFKPNSFSHDMLSHSTIVHEDLINVLRSTGGLRESSLALAYEYRKEVIQ